jgi:hypothetical protein
MKIIKVLIFMTTIVVFVFYLSTTELSKRIEKKDEQISIGPKKSVEDMPMGIHKKENEFIGKLI